MTEKPEMEPDEWDLMITVIATLNPEPYARPVRDLIEKAVRVCEAEGYSFGTATRCEACDGRGWVER